MLHRKLTGSLGRVLTNFVIKLEYKPQNWEDRITTFIAFLIDNGNPESSIRSYVSGIKAVLKDDGVEIDDNSLFLASLLKACKYTNSQVNMRIPIHKGMLQIINLSNSIWPGTKFI